MADESGSKKPSLWTWLAGIEARNVLAFGVTLVTLLVIWSLARTIVQYSQDKSGGASAVFNALLPLLGSWVGTILAYYFSKENFEAATKSVTELTKTVTSLEKLKATLTKDKMIKLADMFHKKLPAKDIKLLELLEQLEKQAKGNRVPVLTEKSFPAHVIHRSTIDRFLADKARGGATKDQLAALTLEDLLKEPALKSWVEKSFVTVALDSNLAQAKEKLEAFKYCQDVFVTQNGTADEPVVGWITNVIIQENSKV